MKTGPQMVQVLELEIMMLKNSYHIKNGQTDEKLRISIEILGL
jgi:hypothetical protein